MNTRVTRSLRSTALAVVFAALPIAAAAQTAQESYTAAKTRDDQVRKGIAATPATAPLADRTKVITEARAVISAYQTLVRRFRASGYADNALFNAATLAEALHQQFSLTTDLDAALRLYKRLNAEYPTAPLAREAGTALTRLAPVAAANAVAEVNLTDAAPAPAAPPAAAAAKPPAKAPAGRARLTSIERAVLPDVVRVTLGLDREVPYHEETLTGPARVFFDFKNVEAAAPLVDAVLRYPSDLVRQIRVGRHPNAIRVVLDLEGVSRHSVYTLYNPFRIVIDSEIPSTARVTQRLTSTPPLEVEDEKPVVLTNTRNEGEPLSASDDTEGPAPAAAAPPARVAPVAPAAPLAPAPAAPLAPVAPLAPAAPVAPKVNAAGGFSIARQLGLGISRIVIDPGHGGHDPGAENRGLKESDLTLDIALRLEKLLQEEPGLEVVLTRRTDTYVPLEARTEIANREGADLFLSIHANTSRSATARGVETYFLSFAGSPEAEAVAARENSSHAGEMHTLPDIIKAIALNNKLDESRDLAAMVQEALVTRLRRSNRDVQNRGVKKAPFVVLIGAEMPSVLAEVSFISNRQEQQLLKSSAYKQRIAEALQAAVLRYRRSLKAAAVAATSDKEE